MVDIRTLVVVPAWNEERSIASVVRSLRVDGFDVLVVDDGSTDRTRQVARGEGALVASLPFNLGVGAALRCGFRYAVEHGYDAVVQCDADGQHPVNHIRDLIDSAKSTDAHMVIGSRFVDGSATRMRLSLIRRFAMRILSRSATRAVGREITDSTSGFRIIRQPLLGELAKQLAPYYLGDTYEAIISAGRAGYRVDEIHAPISEREYGESSAHPLKAARLTLKAILSAIMHVHPRLKGPSSQATR